jgi:DNA polymerase-3 subunit alpha
MDLNKIKRFEIHMHDEYSNIILLDSITTSKKLIATAYKLGLSGCCLTNHECLSGSVVFKKNEKELKKKGEISEDFKCAIGNEIYCIEKRTRESIKYYHLILIAKNADGYEALKKLSSIAWLLSYNASRGKMRRVPTLYSELEAVVEEYKGSLICTSACLGSVFSQLLLEYIKLVKENKVEEKELKLKEIDGRINFFVKLFEEDFYIEIAPGNTKDQIEYNKAAFRYAKSRNLKIVIGTDAHYATKDDKSIHKAYLNSKDGEREVDDFYSSTYLMDNEECYNTYFKNLFTEEEFIEFCNNSMEIYEKIENYSLSKPQNIPTRDVEDYPKANLSDYMVIGSYHALEKLIQSDNPQERYWINNCLIQLNKKGLNNEEYLKRLETEAEVILFISDKLNVTLVSYFNTLREIFKTILACGSIIEPGRGSSVGFLSDYLLGITQLDPIKYGLPYWRFLNNERVELPKIYWAV